MFACSWCQSQKSYLKFCKPMKAKYCYSLEQTRRQPSGPGPVRKGDLDISTRNGTFYGFLRPLRRKDGTGHALNMKGWNWANHGWPVSPTGSFWGRTGQSHSAGCGVMTTTTTRSPGATSAQIALTFSKLNENTWTVLFHPQKLHFYSILFMGENVIEDHDHNVIVANDKIRRGDFFWSMSAENNAAQPPWLVCEQVPFNPSFLLHLIS